MQMTHTDRGFWAGCADTLRAQVLCVEININVGILQHRRAQFVHQRGGLKLFEMVNRRLHVAVSGVDRGGIHPQCAQIVQHTRKPAAILLRMHDRQTADAVAVRAGKHGILVRGHPSFVNHLRLDDGHAGKAQ